MRTVVLIAGLLVALVAVVFAIANRTSVTLNLWPLPYTYDAPVFVLVFIAFGVGLVLGVASAWYARLARNRRARRAATASPAKQLIP